MPSEVRKAVPAGAGEDDHATVVISRTVRSGHEQEYMGWVSRLISAAEAFPDNLGAVVLTPEPGESNVFHIVHRFADEASLQAWEDSETRRTLSAEADTFSTLQRQEATGMETWFAVGSAAGSSAPKKWKMASLTFVVVYCLTAIVIPREMAWLPRSWSFYVTNIFTNVIIATLMTYVIMPVLARVLKRWLYAPS
ncbi:antibiotic biosynthesis monooxygenase [Streptacidiphilus cavernicola]|uniref:Antibiotic biosynthesis monooxygenase n=1 Tax=Streptacidiphilus cavernicola TaxID=3342716 RepID=A0ABV6W566_9ACTN